MTNHPAFALVAKWDAMIEKSPAKARTDELRAEEQARSLVEYKRVAPCPEALDELEKRAQRCEVSVVRQVRPGTYEYVKDGQLLRTV